MPKKPVQRGAPRPHHRSRRNSKYSRARGMKDILFEEYKYYNLVVTKARDLAEVYGFRSISTPVIERTDLYESSIGKSSDLLNKELYSFLDRNSDKIALRPEIIPGLARAFNEHGMINQPQPVKMFSLGPVFRFENPGSGRYRQHTQFGFAFFGEDSPVADAQLILIAYNFFSELQIDVQVQINSIGDKEDQREYIEKLIEFYKERGKRSKLCNDCKRRFLKDPLRLLSCVEENCQEVRVDAPQIVDYLSDDAREHFIKVLEYLDELDIPYNLNPTLVRDRKYHNRTIFEFTPVADTENTEDEGGSGRRQELSLGGGGRFDKLISALGGEATPGVGFSIGIERVILKIKEKNIPLKPGRENIVFVAQLGDAARRKVFVLFEEMRRTGYHMQQAFTEDSLKNQLETAQRIGARYSLILGQKELLDGTIIIRDMESGTQEVIDNKKIYAEIGKRLAADKEESGVVGEAVQEKEEDVAEEKLVD